MTKAKPEQEDGRPTALGERAGASSRLARWRASWRIAGRMARRDLRRHKGRSALVVVMVAGPVALLVAAACWLAANQLTTEDKIVDQMGAGQALVQEPQEQAIAQSADGSNWGSGDTKAKVVPGAVVGADNTAALQRLIGGTLIPVTEMDARFLTGGRRLRIHGLVIKGQTADLGPKAELTAGRWPKNNSEIVVTPAGADKSLPGRGTITVSCSGKERQVEVVGSANARNGYGGQPDFIVPAAWDDAVTYGRAWILARKRPVLWPEVRSLNEYGIAVTSAAVLRHPPSISELDPSMRTVVTSEQSRTSWFVVVGSAMLFLVTALLVGPAFAVSASRQRRTLALAACNGAETRQLRRSVLAQALVLGVAAALAGAAVGAAAVWVAIALREAAHPGATSEVFRVPWLNVAIILPCAASSALAAALLPALRLGRLDIVGVMRGQSVSPPANRVQPIIGALLAAGGGFALLQSIASGASALLVTIAAFALVIGALLTVPTLLVAAGALASRLPVGLRMAARDAARHRSRSTPTIVAILAGVAALTVFTISLASDTEHAAREYVPQAPFGVGVVTYQTPDARLLVQRTLKRVAPSLVQTPLLVVGSAQTQDQAQGQATRARVPFVGAIAPGRTLAQSVSQEDAAGAESQVLGPPNAANSRIIALPVGELARDLGLTDSERRVLAAGGIATVQSRLVRKGHVDMATATAIVNPATGEYSDVIVGARRSMPVVQLPMSALTTGQLTLAGSNAGAMVAIETARKLGWPLAEYGILLRSPDGPIGAATQKALDQSLGGYDEFSLYVERGYVRTDAVVMKVMFAIAALLLLIVTLISTALSLAEQQTTMGTFAAVGATRGTRRRLAGSQAIMIGLMGAVLGLMLGLLLGTGVAYRLTAHQADIGGNLIDPTISIPWLPLLVVALGVPLLAGMLSAAAIRRAPEMTRRAD